MYRRYLRAISGDETLELAMHDCHEREEKQFFMCTIYVTGIEHHDHKMTQHDSHTLK